MGTADAGLLAVDSVFLDKSNFRGRGFIFESVGDPGSFFTMTLGRPASPSVDPGEDFAAEKFACPLGLLASPFFCGAALALLLLGPEGAAGVLWAD